MSYVDGFLWDNPSLTGVLLGVGTSVGAAMYQVCALFLTFFRSIRK